MRRSLTIVTRRAGLVLALAVLLVIAFAGGWSSAQAPGKADMAIVSVSDSPDPVLTGQRLTYAVGVENLGPNTATAVAVATTLPSGVRFEPGLSNPACAESGGTVTCGFATWAVNAAAQILITVTPSTAGILQLTFTVSATERDPDLSNNSQTVTTTVVEPTEADVSIDMPTSAEGYAGQNIFLGVQVRNVGPATATGVILTLELPSGVNQSYGGGACTDTASGQTCRYDLGSMPAQSTAIDLIGLTAGDAGTFTLQGSVSAEQPDPLPSNNSDSTLLTATPAADLSAQITESSEPATPGSDITYTVTVTNGGPSPASTITLTDTWTTTVAGGVRLVSVATSQGQCTLTNQQIDCQLDGLASGANATVTVTLRPRGTGSVTDHTQVLGAEYDPNTANNTATETTTIGPA